MGIIIKNMDNNEVKKIIDKKTIGDVEYKLCYWPKDKLFVISKWDLKLEGINAHRIPVIFESSDEKKAKEYFRRLGK